MNKQHQLRFGILSLSLILATSAQRAFGQVSVISKGFVAVDTISGDLNKDGLEDRVLLIKATERRRFVAIEGRGRVDRNRRGIVILFRNGAVYELVQRNDTCFSSENEDGGVYFPPELDISISKGNLICHYAHGRYGFWTYTFRYQQGDFYLIGYDQTDGGAVTQKQVSINFLTKKVQTRVNTNESAEAGEEVFRESWKPVKVGKLVRLSEIRDFDALELPDSL